jgi:Major Facilitator Superfamily
MAATPRGAGATGIRTSFALNPVMLIAARIAQGGLGALMIPQGIAIMTKTFPRDMLAKAFAAFGPLLGLSSIAGPVVAGFLIDANVAGLGWRPVFLINIVRPAWGLDLLVLFATAIAAEHTTRDKDIDAPNDEAALMTAVLHAPPDTYPHIAALGPDLLSGPGEARLAWGFQVLINGTMNTPTPDPTPPAPARTPMRTTGSERRWAMRVRRGDARTAAGGGHRPRLDARTAPWFGSGRPRCTTPCCIRGLPRGGPRPPDGRAGTRLRSARRSLPRASRAGAGLIVPRTVRTRPARCGLQRFHSLANWNHSLTT